MITCSNCGGAALGEDILRVAHKGRVVVVLCTPCVSLAAKPRITLSRSSEKDVFAYEQYVCVETLALASDVQED